MPRQAPKAAARRASAEKTARPPAKAAKKSRTVGRSKASNAASSAADPEIKSRSAKVVRTGGRLPRRHVPLVHDSALQLLVATILSAQCTDARVNIVTKDLFQRWPKAADLARLPIGRLEKAIQSTGFFRNKAKSIKACCLELMEKYDGQVPREMDQLVALAGVGRKTANVVLGTAYGLPTGVVVDTHVGRISRRLGLTKHSDPVKVEQDLMQLLPQSEWINYSHRMIHHGRKICDARKPLCSQCSMEKFCPKIGVASPKP